MKIEEMTVNDYRNHCCKCGWPLSSTNPVIASDYHIGAAHKIHIGECCGKKRGEK